MKYKDLLNKIGLLQNTFNSFLDYSKKLDKYFENEENIKNHIELYNYYDELKNKLILLKRKK